MRFWFLITGLMTALTGSSQVIHNTTKYNITPFTMRCCEELQLDSCLIFIDTTDNILAFGVDGHAREVDKGVSYAILIRKNLSFEHTEMIIAHELVHIKQMKSGMLKFDCDSIRFSNKSYPNIFQRHQTDDHELQAIYIGEMLHEKFKNILINYN